MHYRIVLSHYRELGKYALSLFMFQANRLSLRGEANVTHVHQSQIHTQGMEVYFLSNIAQHRFKLWKNRSPSALFRIHCCRLSFKHVQPFYFAGPLFVYSKRSTCLHHTISSPLNNLWRYFRISFIIIAYDRALKTSQVIFI